MVFLKIFVSFLYDIFFLQNIIIIMAGKKHPTMLQLAVVSCMNVTKGPHCLQKMPPRTQDFSIALADLSFSVLTVLGVGREGLWSTEPWSETQEVLTVIPAQSASDSPCCASVSPCNAGIMLPPSQGYCDPEGDEV